MNLNDSILYSMTGISFLAICIVLIKLAFVVKEVTKPTDK